MLQSKCNALTNLAIPHYSRQIREIDIRSSSYLIVECLLSILGGSSLVQPPFRKTCSYLRLDLYVAISLPTFGGFDRYHFLSGLDFSPLQHRDMWELNPHPKSLTYLKPYPCEFVRDLPLEWFNFSVLGLANLYPIYADTFGCLLTIVKLIFLFSCFCFSLCFWLGFLFFFWLFSFGFCFFLLCLFFCQFSFFFQFFVKLLKSTH